MRFLLGLLVGGLLASLYTSHGDVFDAADNIESALLTGHESALSVISSPVGAIEPLVEDTPDVDNVPDTLEDPVPEPEQVEVVALQQPELPPVFQNAWMPFRSERSARGFAEKLSTQLDRQFQVLKRGAGRYEVGFSYASEDERMQGLASVENLTGYRVRELP